MGLRFLSPQGVLVNASLDRTFKAMTAFGQGFKEEGENYSEILKKEGNRFLVKYTTYIGSKIIITKEEVTVYPPNVITYRHLEGPLNDVYEVFTGYSKSSNQTMVNYMGQYRLKKYDWPIIGWIIHKFLVLPKYDSIITRHLAKVKIVSEKN